MEKKQGGGGRCCARAVLGETVSGRSHPDSEPHSSSLRAAVSLAHSPPPEESPSAIPHTQSHTYFLAFPSDHSPGSHDSQNTHGTKQPERRGPRRPPAQLFMPGYLNRIEASPTKFIWPPDAYASHRVAWPSLRSQ